MARAYWDQFRGLVTGLFNNLLVDNFLLFNFTVAAAVWTAHFFCNMNDLYAISLFKKSKKKKNAQYKRRKGFNCLGVAMVIASQLGLWQKKFYGFPGLDAVRLWLLRWMYGLEQKKKKNKKFKCQSKDTSWALEVFKRHGGEIRLPWTEDISKQEEYSLH